MIKRPVVLIVFLFMVLSVQGQRRDDNRRVGIAVEDLSSASLVNIASLGVGNASGAGWSGYLPGSPKIDQTFHAALGYFAYNYRFFNGIQDHELALGFPLMEGLYLGSSWRWNNLQKFGKGSVQLHSLYRPSPWISVGIKAESLNSNPWLDWGVGIRPLSFSKFWGSRLSLFYDGRITSAGRYQNLAAGLRVSPLDGLEVYTHWDFLAENLKTGINLSWNHFFLGGEAPTAGKKSWEEGNIQAFVSTKRMRSIGARQRVLIVYDLASTITDGPRPFASLKDKMPKAASVRSLFEFLSDMEEVKNDPEIKAVLFKNQSFRTSFSNLLEIEEALKEIKAAGKEIYFYYETMDTLPYALAASVGDAVFITPQGSLDISGFNTTKLYLRDFLARFGVRVQNFQSHDFKTAYNMFSESEMTPQERESLEVVYRGLQDEVDRMVLQGRGEKLQGPWEEILDSGNWLSAADALEAGLVDSTMYTDQFELWLGLRRYRGVNFSSRRFEVDYQWDKTNRPAIALIYATGSIVSGTGTQGQSIGSDSLAAAIRSARRSPFINAIVLRVDSGGGSALASDLIAREVALCREGPRPKTVIISMGGAAASGGYMISAPGTKILATPATITGSIGVIAVIPDFSGLLSSFDVGVDGVKTSQSADMFSLLRPLSPEEEARMKDSIMTNYQSFIEMVAENRRMSVESVDAAGQGRIWTGRQGMEKGLVDSMGGLSDALEILKNELKNPDPRILEINPGAVNTFGNPLPGFLSVLLGKAPANPYAPLPEDLQDIIRFAKSLDQYKKGEALYLMPYSLKDMGLDTR